MKKGWGGLVVCENPENIFEGCGPDDVGGDGADNEASEGRGDGATDLKRILAIFVGHKISKKFFHVCAYGISNFIISKILLMV